MSFFPADAQRGISSPYDPFILRASDRYVVDPALIKAVITKESSWSPRAFRAEPQIGDASRGLMQILYGTARGIGFTGTAEDLFDPSVNIEYGTKYLAAQLSRFGYPQGVSAYNAGRPISGNAQYVADVDAGYQWFIANDPLFAPSGGGATYFPRVTASEWRERRRLLAERG